MDPSFSLTQYLIQDTFSDPDQPSMYSQAIERDYCDTSFSIPSWYPFSLYFHCISCILIYPLLIAYNLLEGKPIIVKGPRTVSQEQLHYR